PRAIELGEELAGEALPGPVARGRLARRGEEGFAELPSGGLAQEHQTLAGGRAHLESIGAREADHEAGRLRIADATERNQNAGEHAGIVGAHGFLRNGLAAERQLTLGPVGDLGRGVARRLDERRERWLANLVQASL